MILNGIAALSVMYTLDNRVVILKYLHTNFKTKFKGASKQEVY